MRWKLIKAERCPIIHPNLFHQNGSTQTTFITISIAMGKATGIPGDTEGKALITDSSLRSPNLPRSLGHHASCRMYLERPWPSKTERDRLAFHMKDHRQP